MYVRLFHFVPQGQRGSFGRQSSSSAGNGINRNYYKVKLKDIKMKVHHNSPIYL